MFNTLKLSFQIEFCYAINSIIYHMKKIPILKNIFKGNLYEKSGMKKIIGLLSGVYSLCKLILFRGVYFYIIYLLSKWISKDSSYAFMHIYFVFCMIGMMINTYIMSTSKKKYLCMILLKMDAKDFVLSHYYYQSMMNFILNSSYLLIIFHLLDIPLGMGLCLSLFSFFSKTIGEVIHIRYYQKNHVKLLTESLYFFMIILGLGISFLPFFHLYFYPQVIFVMTLIFGFFALYGIYYLHHVKDYPIIYKRLNTYQMVVNQENENAYTRQLMVNIQEKDVHISEKKLKGKKGYDLFNTIFFERHKGILLRSAKLFAITSGILIFITAIVIFEFPSYAPYINQQLTKNLSWVIFILYFINRGAVITQAMFFNCDHAMLTFNFYREPRVILELFKKRLKMLIRINLIPTLVIGIGLVFLLYLSSGKFLLDYVMIFVLILAMSIFFSVHYLVIYYLLQPYSKEMQMKDFRYSIVQLFTYLGCYLFTGLSINMNLFCLLGILFMISYIAISLRLVYKKAPTTFKIQ